MKYKGWDFSGYATRTNIRCSDGRTILNHAFDDCDGKKVPLVWNHQHNDSDNVLGHAYLEKRDDGMYAYGYLNHTPKAENLREQLAHGDVSGLSIFANRLRQSSKTPPCDVIHGVIQELSVVLAPANPGAYIENISLAHGEIVEDEAIIYGADYEEGLLYHADAEGEDEDDDDDGDMSDDEVKAAIKSLSSEQREAAEVIIGAAIDNDKDAVDDEVKEIFKTLTPTQRKAVEIAIGMAKEKESTAEHSDIAPEDLVDVLVAEMGDPRAEFEDAMLHSDSDSFSINEVLNSLSDIQKAAVGLFIQQALASDNITHSDNSYYEEEDDNMKYNAFDTMAQADYEGACLSHAEVEKIFSDAKRLGSLKAAVLDNLESGVLAHAQNDDGTTQTYGIADIDYLFPDAKSLNTPPEFISRNMDWVKKVINGTHHTPFSRVKSMFADITEDEARARGYVKGNKKVEEVFTLLKRVTEPQTIYKLQKLDRDDILDITDFDVVAWIKGEMRMMLEEEIARAILIGDGRNPVSNDKIKEANVRPIITDDDLYTIKVPVVVTSGMTVSEKAEAIEEAIIRSFKDYKGSGNPDFFTTTDAVTDQLLRKDKIGHKIYKTKAELATALRVSDIVEVEVMQNQTVAIKEGNPGSQTTTNYPLIGVIANLKDYNVGADKGGQTSLFDDFDIDYNQFKYLIETRMSGALVKPYSAMVIYLKETQGETQEEP